MTDRLTTRVTLLMVTFFILSATGLPANGQVQEAIFGIDHIPLAVRDLDRASDTFKGLGFTLKAGRPHPNGIQNEHIKFPDGSGIELITSTGRTDAQSAFYRGFARRGEGPAFLSFHCRSTPQLLTTLSNARIACVQRDGMVSLQDPRLDFIFFVSDNRSPTDLPEHFSHRNGALAMSEVWIAMPDPGPLQELFTALGAVASREMRNVPDPVEANVFKLQNGSIVVVPANLQIVAARPVIGVVMKVDAMREAGPPPVGGETPPASADRSPPFDRVIRPNSAHGLWIAFKGDQ